MAIGDRIAQLIVIEMADLDFAQEKRHLSPSARGDCGFGSTGVKTEKKRARLSEDEPMEQTDDTEYEPSESSSSERSDTTGGNESTAESTEETEQEESSSSGCSSGD